MALSKPTLKQYRMRRNFAKSPEPTAIVSGGHSKGGRTFVIHKHDATHLHYDMRLSSGGVLKSWALPKEPTTSPAHKCLAIPTEDHPLAYARFEGVIPEGQYGAGTVMVWDRGMYTNIKKKNGKILSMKECFAQGTIEIFIKGEKLYGAYALVRTSMYKGVGNQQWLLIKMKDEYAHHSFECRHKSVLTGRTMQQIRRDAHTAKKKRSVRRKRKDA